MTCWKTALVRWRSKSELKSELWIAKTRQGMFGEHFLRELV